MVELKNILRQNGVLSCDYFPEHSEMKGHIEIDESNGEVLSDRSLVSEYPDGKKLYFSAATAKLRSYVGIDGLPDTAYAVFM